MTPRFPLSVAVLGALLVGGAATGTTDASWTDQRPLAGSSVGSGSMSFATTTPAGVTVARIPGDAATTSFALDDTSVGKKLQQQVTARVTGTPTGVTATVGTSCPGAGSVQVTTTPASADVPLCVRVVSSATAASGTVTLAVSGAQLPSGWTTPVSTLSVPVSVSTLPAAPVVACNGPNQNGFTWSAAAGATGYVVATSATQTGTYSDVSTTTSTSHTPTISGQSTSFFRVRATNTSGSSPVSNTVRIVRTGNSHTCSQVTP